MLLTPQLKRFPPPLNPQTLSVWGDAKSITRPLAGKT